MITGGGLKMKYTKRSIKKDPFKKDPFKLEKKKKKDDSKYIYDYPVKKW